MNPLTTLVNFLFTHVIDVRLTTGAMVVVVVVVVDVEVVSFETGTVEAVTVPSATTICGPGKVFRPKFLRAIPVEFVTVALA